MNASSAPLRTPRAKTEFNQALVGQLLPSARGAKIARKLTESRHAQGEESPV